MFLLVRNRRCVALRADRKQTLALALAALVCCIAFLGCSRVRADDILPSGSPPGAEIVYAGVAEGRENVILWYAVWPAHSALAVSPKLDGKYGMGNHVEHPTFSPNGEKVLFLANRVLPDGTEVPIKDNGIGFDLWLWDVRKDSATALTMDSAGYDLGHWSPNGKYISDISFEGYEIPSPEGGAPSLSSTYQWKHNLYVWDVHTRNRRLLVRYVDSPIWSPDSKRIYFEGVIGDERPAFLSVGLSGGKPTTVLVSNNSTWLGEWSPDGRFLAYSEYVPERKGHVLSLLPADGRKPRMYYAFKSPITELEWSQDGRKIAFVNYFAFDPVYQGKLTVMDIGNGEAKEMWRSAGTIDIIGWSRDGKWLIASRNKTLEPTCQQELVATPVAGGKPVILAAPEGRVTGFDWHELPGK
jgi:Tol biopolymer transport system component